MAAPTHRRLYSREQYLADREAFDRQELVWLLGFGQGERQAPAIDEMHVEHFVADYLDPEVEISTDLVGVRRLAEETVKEIRRVVEGDAWEFEVSETICVGIEPAGERREYRARVFLTRDFRAAFRLRASDLAYRYWGRIRTCKRPGCKRLFVAADKRQVFCSRECSQKTQFEKYVKSIGGKKAWRKKHREQYHQRKEAKDNGTKTQRG